MNPKLKRLITIYFMGAGYALVYALPFIQYVFYQPLQDALQTTNQKLGLLIAIYGIGNLIAPFGGWLADRVNYKLVYMAGLLGTGVLCFLFAFNMNYSFALIVWGLLALTTLILFYPAHIKAVRLMADRESQGQIYGLAESAGGVGSVIVNAIAMFLFTRTAVEVTGLKYAIIGYGVATILVSIIIWFLIKDQKPVEADTEVTTAVTLSDFFRVLQYPGTWLAGISIFCVYTLYVSMSYFTPYFTDVLGMGAATAGVLGIIRTYVIRFIGAPLGGMFGDRMKSVTKALVIAYAGAIGVALAVIFLPPGTAIAILVTLSLLLSVFAYIGRANMFAVPTEVRSPEKFAAITGGVACAIGFSPDLFVFQLFGSWIDKFGNTGYHYIFMYLIGIMALGLVNAILLFRFKKSSKFGTLQ